MEIKKTNECVIAIVALGVLLLGLIGYVTLEKTIWKKECVECESSKIEVSEDKKRDKEEADDEVDDIVENYQSPGEIQALALAGYLSTGGGCQQLRIGGAVDSSVAPYQTLTVMRGGYPDGSERCADVFGGDFILFYRTGPEAEWEFFTGGHQIGSCDQFNTDDKKKAFADYECPKPDGTMVPVSSLL